MTSPSAAREPVAPSEAAEHLGRLRRLPGRAEALRRFEDVLAEPQPETAIRRAKADGQKVIGTFCMLVPNEIMHAAGAVAVRLCGGSAAAAERVPPDLPRDLCPLLKSAAGTLLPGEQELLRALDLVVVPATCDWKAKFGGRLREHVPTVTLDVVHGKEAEGARQAWRREIERFYHEVEGITEAEIGRRELLASVGAYQRATVLSRSLVESMRADPPPLWGSDLLLVHNALFYMPIEEWTEAAGALVQAARMQDPGCRMQGTPGRRPRVLLAGSPTVWPDYKLPLLIEQSGGRIVADESCAGSRQILDAVEVDEPTVRDALWALADRYYLPCSCPCFTPNVDRQRRLAAVIEDYRVDGVVYHVLKSCFLYDAELGATREALTTSSSAGGRGEEEPGTPVLRLETDLVGGSEEQLRNRLDAFLEMLRERRRRDHHKAPG